MGKHSLVVFLIAWILSVPALARSQAGHPQSGHTSGHTKDMKPAEKKAAPPALKPAEGASVKVLSPKDGQVFKGDQIPLQFKLVKGKRGNHVHAYVDGELMGMFQSSKGTLTGIRKGTHTLELRVVAEDHQTELNATDKVGFTVK